LEVSKSSGLLFTDTIAFVSCPKCGVAPGKDCQSEKKISWAPHIERLKLFMSRPEYKKENYTRRLLFGTELEEILGAGTVKKFEA
jgi:hypothetical protein